MSRLLESIKKLATQQHELRKHLVPLILVASDVDIGHMSRMERMELATSSTDQDVLEELALDCDNDQEAVALAKNKHLTEAAIHSLVAQFDDNGKVMRLLMSHKNLPREIRQKYTGRGWGADSIGDMTMVVGKTTNPELLDKMADIAMTSAKGGNLVSRIIHNNNVSNTTIRKLLSRGNQHLADALGAALYRGLVPTDINVGIIKDVKGGKFGDATQQGWSKARAILWEYSKWWGQLDNGTKGYLSELGAMDIYGFNKLYNEGK